ncbi:V-set and immunoglobulin domain-containing protein 10 [Halichoeres trimaculatus]|uniref:V-set and immunoglobulin domain-containing protein 10 n=1 Tax=Halichoeres trimaculatus TaxID=147232 RepID=UPI003D9E6853
MKKVATAALLLLCFCATVSGDVPTETALKAEPGDVALLPCYSAGNVTPALTTWMKNGREVVSGGASSPAGEQQRLSVLHDGSLNIRGVTPGDEGSYLCSSTLPGNNTFRARVLLQVASGPANISTSITPSTALSNRTLIVHRDSTVSFNCSASSYPAQLLTWSFRGATSSNESLVSSSGSWLDFRIDHIQPSDQGVYTCRANNSVSSQAVNESTELLVYYVPDVHPECMWTPAQDPSHVFFTCFWYGAYPTPTLHIGEDQAGQGAASGRHVNVSKAADSLSVMLNHSQLSEGQTLRCSALHPVLAAGEKECSLTLKSPFPEGEPLTSALDGTSVTLMCSESTSNPPANTTWRKGLEQQEINPGQKYVISEEGPVLKLTILNITKDDEGVYFCRSENALAVTELEVYLTVRTTSSAYTGAIIGIFIAVLIVGSAAIIAKTLYSSRHRICLGSGFGQMDDRGDVLSLVESDDEQIFQDAVPRLPPITNGHQTTLVQIHRIPSSDHEEAETVDTSPQQHEDTVHTEESGDLVTF